MRVISNELLKIVSLKCAEIAPAGLDFFFRFGIRHLRALSRPIEAVQSSLRLLVVDRRFSRLSGILLVRNYPTIHSDTYCLTQVILSVPRPL